MATLTDATLMPLMIFSDVCDDDSNEDRSDIATPITNTSWHLMATMTDTDTDAASDYLLKLPASLTTFPSFSEIMMIFGDDHDDISDNFDFDYLFFK